MPFTLTMPKLSPTMEEGSIVKWHKKPGDFVHSGDLLLEVATDKATVEYNALDEGWLRQVLIREGEEAVVNQPIGVFTLDEKENYEGYEPEGVFSSIHENKIGEQVIVEENTSDRNLISQSGKKSKRESVFEQPQFLPEPPLDNYSFEYPRNFNEKRIFASPLAKKLAKEQSIDLTTIKGTGPNQRIMSRDLVRGQVSGLVGFNHRGMPTTAPGTFDEIPLSPMRKVIGQRLQESKSFIPHFYVTQVINAEPLVTLREQLKSHEVKVSINDLIVKACALALQQHPGVNTGFNSVNQSIIQFKTIDIAIAVSVDGGLFTPIVRNVDYKNLGEIALEIRSLVQKAKNAKLLPHEYKGGSFTVSNLGMYGISEFKAILNPPQSAILAVAAIQDTPVVQGGNIVCGKTLALTLSVDHRVIDGVAAASFLQTLKKTLENPSILIVF